MRARTRFERRLKEFSKLLKHLTKQAASDVESWLNETCDRKVERICQSPDSPARREKLKKLFDQRDKQIKRAHTGVNDFVKQTVATFRKPGNAVEALREFWGKAGRRGGRIHAGARNAEAHRERGRGGATP